MDKYVLAQIIAQTAPSGWALRQGEAVSVQADYTATVKIAGSETAVTGVRYMGQPPKPGAGVWLMVSDTDLLIVGSIAASGRTVAPRVYRTTNQTINSGSATPIVWDAEDSDGHGFWASGQTVEVTIPGRYVAVGQADLASASAGARSASVLVDGVAFGSVSVGADAGTARLNVHSLPFTVSASASVELWVEQSSGGGLDVVASGSVSPGLGVFYLGA